MVQSREAEVSHTGTAAPAWKTCKLKPGSVIGQRCDWSATSCAALHQHSARSVDTRARPLHNCSCDRVCKCAPRSFHECVRRSG